jgi:hypothetical protein
MPFGLVCVFTFPAHLYLFGWMRSLATTTS